MRGCSLDFTSFFAVCASSPVDTVCLNGCGRYLIYSVVLLWTAVVYRQKAALRGDYLCMAGQITLFPLFKPAALPLWSALMPLIQYV